MKAKVIATGEIVDVEFSHKATTRDIYFYKDLKTNEMYNMNGLVFLDEKKPTSEIDWEQRRFELVKVILQVKMTDTSMRTKNDDEFISYCLNLADMVIEKMKGGEQ